MNFSFLLIESDIPMITPESQHRIYNPPRTKGKTLIV